MDRTLPVPTTEVDLERTRRASGKQAQSSRLSSIPGNVRVLFGTIVATAAAMVAAVLLASPAVDAGVLAEANAWHWAGALTTPGAWPPPG